MARITNYDNDAQITTGDKLLGTDTTGSTVNYPVEDLQRFILRDGVYSNIVPQDRLVSVNSSGGPTQAQVFERTDSVNNVSIPTEYGFQIRSTGNNTFEITLSRFGREGNFFPYDINSFVGKTWTSTEYPTAGSQTITALAPTPLSSTSTAENQTWTFTGTISTPRAEDSASTISRVAMTNVVISSLDQKTVVIGANAEFLGTGGGGITFGNAATNVAPFAEGDNAARTTPIPIPSDLLTEGLQLGTNANQALRGDTTTITGDQASAIVANTAKVTFPGFGTTSGTSLEGDTTLPSLPGDLPVGRVSGLNLNTAPPVIFTASAAATTQAAVETEFYAVATNTYITGQLAYLFYNAAVQNGALAENLIFISTSQTAPADTQASDWRTVASTFSANVVLHDATGVDGRLAIFGTNGNIIGDSGITVDTTADSITATTFVGALQGNALTASRSTSAGESSEVVNNRVPAESVSIWFGTQAQFDAITEVTDGSVLYIIQ